MMASTDIRSVTGDEVRHLRDHGWVKLDQLISPRLSARLLNRARALMGPAGDGHPIRPGIDIDTTEWADYHDVVEEDEVFASLGLSRAMGGNAQLLIRRDIGILMWSNYLAVKVGTKQGSPRPSEPAVLRQDGPDLPIDRPGWVRFWIALDRVSPEMGPIRLVDRSHRLGLLGRSYLGREGNSSEAALFAEYPEIAGMTVIDDLEFEPGDAVAYGMHTLYGDRANFTDKPRWALVVTYFAEDTFYTGNQLCSGETVQKVARAGLTPGDEFGGPVFHRVCDIGE
jgi:Phytanoyl-CoA dioxygenase (PhyH)